MKLPTKNEKPHPVKTGGLRRKLDLSARMCGARIGRKADFSYADEKFGMFCPSGLPMLSAKMPHRQLLWPVAANAKLWFEALKMARILRSILQVKRSREIIR
ncbi:hypothetical protein [Rhizobium leguminosarum]|uniref:hypothetical protein n=1 Tax=Rhizobium leguminosarum TaxID=384 RepID=UPI0011D0FE0A|nr:hypothetical protein [Rhizobium leguminosarum]